MSDGNIATIKALKGYLLNAKIDLETGATKRTAIQTIEGGIRLADGRTIAAKRAVIANVTPQLLFGKLLPQGSGNAALDQKFTSFRPGPGTMMVHLALNDLPDWAAGNELKRFAYVHIAPDYAYMTSAYAQAIDGLLPRAPVLVVGQPTVVDPSRPPDGKHILWVQVRVLPKHVTGDAAGEITKAYKAEQAS